MVRLGEVAPEMWDDVVDSMVEAFRGQKPKFNPDSFRLDWRPLARANRIDRELFEEYGMFKDYILHPVTQSVLSLWERYVNPSPTVEPEIPLPTSIIVLVMLHKRIPTQAFYICAAFLFNANPLYVSIFVVLHLFFKWATAPQPPEIEPGVKITERDDAIPFPEYLNMRMRDVSGKSDTQSSYIAAMTPSEPGKKQYEEYDHVVLGAGLDALFVSAALARAGYRVCVLEPKGAAPTCVQPPGAPCAAPLHNCSVGSARRIQTGLDALQYTTDSTPIPSSTQSSDASGRVLLRPIGSSADGYMHTVLCIAAETHGGPGSAATAAAVPPTSFSGDGSSGAAAATAAAVAAVSSTRYNTVGLGAGEETFVNELAAKYSISKPAVSTLLLSIRNAYLGLGNYLRGNSDSAVATGAAAEKTSSSGDSGGAAMLNEADEAEQFKRLAQSSVDQLLAASSDRNALSDVLAAAAVAGSDEACPGSVLSGVGLAHQLHRGLEGMFYPAGGVIAVRKSLIRTITSRGGDVLRDVPVTGIRIDDESPGNGNREQQQQKKNNQRGSYRAVGVEVSIFSAGAPTAAAVANTNKPSTSSLLVRSKGSTISAMGALCTYTRLVPSRFVGPAVRETLSGLSEASAKIRVVFWIRGSLQDTGLSAADFVEIPVPDEPVELHAADGGGNILSTISSNANSHANFSRDCVRVWSPSAKDASWTHPDTQVVVVEFAVSSSLTSFGMHSFEDAPIFTGGGGARIGNEDERGERAPASSSPGAGARMRRPRGPCLLEASFSRMPPPLHRHACGISLELGTSEQARFQASAHAKLAALYPKAAQLVVMTHVVPPIIGGHKISGGVEKYPESRAAQPVEEIQGLHVCAGADCVSHMEGELLAARVTAEAILEG
jgi:hypothetical protein